MESYPFETVDVFTERQFGGNPLAVFPDARGLSDTEMQALAAELNLSETTFVLARAACFASPTLRLEIPAGVVPVEIKRKDGVVVGGRLTAPRPLEVGRDYPADEVAVCVGLEPDDILVAAHPPVAVSMGNPYVVAQVEAEALARCVPDLRAFRAFRARHAELGSRFSLHLYAGDGPELRARMFAPLAGTIEDPATGSANAPLAGLLVSIRGAESAEFVVRQGEEMGRPSLLTLTARRERDGIVATVAGRCVPVLSGLVQLAR